MSLYKDMQHVSLFVNTSGSWEQWLADSVYHIWVLSVLTLYKPDSNCDLLLFDGYHGSWFVSIALYH